MIAPPARLHHGANTAAMGVRARQFRAVAVDLPQNRLAPNKLRAAHAYCGEPTQTATSGVLEALGTGPQDAPRSLRNCA
jgi:hypothetical protein